MRCFEKADGGDTAAFAKVGRVGAGTQLGGVETEVGLARWVACWGHGKRVRTDIQVGQDFSNR